MPQFVVQHHTFPDREGHYDLMFEAEGVLWTWSLAAPPDDAAGVPEPAKQLPDHRIVYLEFEGPVGGGRGEVAIYDRGEFRWLGESPEAGAELADELLFELSGQRCRGRFRLRRVPDDGTDFWRLTRLPS